MTAERLEEIRQLSDAARCDYTTETAKVDAVRKFWDKVGPTTVLAMHDLIKRQRGALEPFAKYYEQNDCDSRSLDDAIEVPIFDLRRARSAWEG